MADANVTQNTTVALLLFIPFFITIGFGIGKILFDDGLVFLSVYFNVNALRKKSNVTYIDDDKML